MDEHNEPLTEPTTTEPAALPPTDAAAAADRKPVKRRRFWPRWLITIIIAVILALIAWFGWRWWQAQAAPATANPPTQTAAQPLAEHSVPPAARAASANQQAITKLGARLDTLRNQIGADHDQQAQLRQQLASNAAASAALRAQARGLAQRVTQLEDAVARMARQQHRTRDTAALNDTERLLRVGLERYQLFGDGDGALKAYTLAAHTMATVDDPAFAGVRAAIDSERAQLAATHPAQRAASLAALQQLRAQWPTLPLRPVGQPTDARAAPSAWQRIGHALTQVIRVDHVAPGTLRGSQAPAMTRQLGRLDLAQAQASLLAADRATSHAALQAALAIVTARFDPSNAGVERAQATLAQLLAATIKPSATVPLGHALKQLENLRTIRAAAAPSAAPPAAPAAPPATPSPAPMSAGSAP